MVFGSVEIRIEQSPFLRHAGMTTTLQQKNRAIQGHCSRPTVKKRHRTAARTDECHLSFNFPATA